MNRLVDTQYPTVIRVAYISEAKYAMGDRGKMALWFTTCLEPTGIGSCALQYTENETEINIILASFGVTSAEELNGKECYVKYENGFIIYYAAPNDIMYQFLTT